MIVSKQFFGSIFLTSLVLVGLFAISIKYYKKQTQVTQSVVHTYSVPVGPLKQANFIQKNTTTSEHITTPCINGYKLYIVGDASFEFPCDWRTDIANKTSWSAVGEIVAPDDTASFHYPGPDFGLDGWELINRNNVVVDGSVYLTEVYSGSGEIVTFIRLGEYDIMYAYKNKTHINELERILTSFTINKDINQ